MPSFDTVLEPNLVEVRNAVDQTAKEIGTRFDFKGSSARVELGDEEITLFADSEFQIGQVMDILIAKLTKRSVDVRFIDKSAAIEKIGGDKVKQVLTVKSGVDSETAKKIQTAIKQSKMKVQAAIQGDTVRVTGAKRDDLQTAMQLIKKTVPDAPGVRYLAVAGVCEAQLRGPEWWLPHSIVDRAEGPNDGVVSVASARWGEHTDVWKGDHLNLVNWPNRFARRRGLWESLAPDYGRIVRRIAEAG